MRTESWGGAVAGTMSGVETDGLELPELSELRGLPELLEQQGLLPKLPVLPLVPLVPLVPTQLPELPAPWGDTQDPYFRVEGGVRELRPTLRPARGLEGREQAPRSADRSLTADRSLRTRSRLDRRSVARWYSAAAPMRGQVNVNIKGEGGWEKILLRVV